MSDVPPTQQKIVQIRSGNVCAFPGCQTPLIKKAAYGTRTLVIGEMAHIISEKPNGPRGNHFLPAGEHNKYPNLMFMCLEHHTEIDKLVEKYPVELLRQIKKNHEDAVEKAVVQTKLKEQSETILPLVNEVVYSTLLPVTRMPKYIFSAPCSYGDSQQKEAARKVLVAETPYLCPFIIRNGSVLFAFNDLRQPDGPFRNIIDLRGVRISKAESWLTMRFGEKVGIIIPTTLMASKVQWPGIPEEFARPFTNIDYEEDLFTSAEFQQFQTEDSEFVQEIETESEGIEDDLGE